MPSVDATSCTVAQLEVDDEAQLGGVRPNVKPSIEWIGHALREAKLSTIVNCWRTTAILPDNSPTESAEKVPENEPVVGL